MERSEPSLVPEWLRSNGSVHHSASSQADGPVLALPRRTRSSKSIGNTDCLHSPLLDRSISSNSRRSSNSNGYSQHDKNSHSWSYSSFSRSHRDRDRDRDRERERSTIADNLDSEYSDPLRSMISGRAEVPLRRSHSPNSRRQGEVPQQKTLADMRNGIHKNYDNGNGTHASSNNVAGTQKVSFERDFPVLRSEDRPKTPDVMRVSSPGLSRAIQSLSIANTPSVNSETWTSALVDVPSSAGSLPTLQPAITTSASSSNSVSAPASTLSGLKMAEALLQSPAQPQNNTQPSVQFQKEELALAQSKKLIPMTSSKTLVRSSSDKLKPRTHTRPSDTTVTLKNGVQHLSPLQLGSQPVRGNNVGPKSPSSSLGRLQLLKPGRENGVSPRLKDLQSPSSNINNRVANGQSMSNPSMVSGPSKNSHSPKMLPVERKALDKRISRSNFFKLVREKSLNNSSGPSDSGVSASLDREDKSNKDSKELDGVQVTPAEPGTGSKCSDNTCTVVDSFSPSLKIDNEEERAFLLSLGWEDHDEGDEEGLTEEEIYDCYVDVMKQRPTSRLCRVLQAKIFSHTGCSSSTEANNPASVEKTC